MVAFFLWIFETESTLLHLITVVILSLSVYSEVTVKDAYT